MLKLTEYAIQHTVLCPQLSEDAARIDRHTLHTSDKIALAVDRINQNTLAATGCID